MIIIKFFLQRLNKNVTNFYCDLMVFVLRITDPSNFKLWYDYILSSLAL